MTGSSYANRPLVLRFARPNNNSKLPFTDLQDQPESIKTYSARAAINDKHISSISTPVFVVSDRDVSTFQKKTMTEDDLKNNVLADASQVAEQQNSSRVVIENVATASITKTIFFSSDINGVEKDVKGDESSPSFVDVCTPMVPLVADNSKRELSDLPTAELKPALMFRRRSQQNGFPIPESSLSINTFVTTLFKFVMSELKELCCALTIAIEYRYSPVTKDQILQEIVNRLCGLSTIDVFWEHAFLSILRHSGKTMETDEQTVVPPATHVLSRYFLSRVEPQTNMPINALQKALKEKGLPVSGTRVELVERLYQQTLRETSCRLPNCFPSENKVKTFLPKNSYWTGFYRISDEHADHKLELVVSDLMAPTEISHWRSTDRRYVVSVLCGYAIRNGLPFDVFVVLSITIDGCVLAKIEDIQYAEAQEILEGEIRSDTNGMCCIRGRVAHQNNGVVSYFKDNCFVIKRDYKQEAIKRKEATILEVSRRQKIYNDMDMLQKQKDILRRQEREYLEHEKQQQRIKERQERQQRQRRRQTLGSCTKTLKKVGIDCQKMEDLWQVLESKINSGRIKEIQFRDIPFPEIPFNLPKTEYNDNQRKNIVRTLQLRWHPDKFMQLFGTLLKETERDLILLRVKEISQAVNALV